MENLQDAFLNVVPFSINPEQCTMAKRRSGDNLLSSRSLTPFYSTQSGQMYVSKTEDALEAPAFEKLTGKVDLVFTSPPFPLIKKKKYGNKTGEDYIAWLDCRGLDDEKERMDDHRRN